MGQNYSEADVAYLAGFLDADGAIMAFIERHHGKLYGYRVRVNIKISQKNRLILDSFLNKYSFGSIRNNRGVFEWEIRDQVQICNLLNNISPYLQVKKIQAQLAMWIIEISINCKFDLYFKAMLADSLSELNVRSPNRRRHFWNEI